MHNLLLQLFGYHYTSNAADALRSALETAGGTVGSFGLADVIWMGPGLSPSRWAHLQAEAIPAADRRAVAEAIGARFPGYRDAVDAFLSETTP